MKLFQPISAALILTIIFAACSSGSSDKEAAGKTDTSTAAAPAVNAIDTHQQELEANKKLVTDFTQLLYGDKDSTAVDKYIADNIKEHNAILKDGKDWLKNALRPFLTNPHIQKTKIDIKQIAADGDKVWVLMREVAPNGKIFARVEIFRIQNGKIVENWLISQPENKTSENTNGMF